MKELVLKAIKAMEQAYTPYSHFQVGAALRSLQTSNDGILQS